MTNTANNVAANLELFIVSSWQVSLPERAAMVEGRMAAQIGAVEESRQIRFSPPVVTEILFIMWATVGFLIFIIQFVFRFPITQF
jgi:hypothetical protein